jgi:hypothetical protein
MASPSASFSPISFFTVQFPSWMLAPFRFYSRCLYARRFRYLLFSERQIYAAQMLGASRNNFSILHQTGAIACGIILVCLNMLIMGFGKTRCGGLYNFLPPFLKVGLFFAILLIIRVLVENNLKLMNLISLERQ